MLNLALWGTIVSERLRMRLDCQIVGCGEYLVAIGCTLGTLMGYFDLTFTLGPPVGVGCFVGGSCRYRLLKMALRSIRVFMDVMSSGGRILFFNND